MATDRRDVLEEVRSRTDIVDLVSSYFPLKRVGQNFSACCPFHEEKTPSFYVSPSRQTFHCFGCHERGTSFDFVMKMDRVGFGDALRLLAERAGVRLDERAPPSGPGSKDLLLRAQAWAQEHFRRAYRSDAGRACRDYVSSRGIQAKIAEEFDISYAPAGWSFLVDRGRNAGVPEETLLRAWLTKPGDRGPYDVFRDRLMFPIRDQGGRIIAFGGRCLDDSKPKYLNSPDTDLFHKGRTVYGLERLHRHRRTQPILVMEGYTDVVMAVQSGVEGSVATLGTALTPDQARLLQRYSDQVILVYDGDQAGQDASERGIPVLLEAGALSLKVVTLPPGQDPCDYFKERGADGVGPLLEGAVDILDFLIERIAGKHEMDSASGRRAAAGVLLPTIAKIADPVSRELALGRVAEMLRLPVSLLRQEAERPSRPQRRDAAPARTEKAPRRQDLLGRIQTEILESVLNLPDLLEERDWIALLPDTRVRSLVELLEEAKSRGARSPGALLDSIGDGDLRTLAQEVLLPEDHGRDLARQLEGAVGRLRKERSNAWLRSAKLGSASGEIDLRRVQREAGFKKRAVHPGFDPDGRARGTGDES